MIAGNAMARSRDIDHSLAEYEAFSFRCWNKNFGGDIGTPSEGPNDTPYLPNKPCPGGIRSNIYFPSWVPLCTPRKSSLIYLPRRCWDGVNLDSPNHQVCLRSAFHLGLNLISHAESHGLSSWPIASTHLREWHMPFHPPCANTHAVHGNCLGHCTIQRHVAYWWQPTLCIQSRRPVSVLCSILDPQALFFSKIYRTGLGQHADYVFGWEGDSLQRIMDKCTTYSGLPQDCATPAGLTLIEDEEMNKCAQREVVPENTHGCKVFISFSFQSVNESTFRLGRIAWMQSNSTWPSASDIDHKL